MARLLVLDQQRLQAALSEFAGTLVQSYEVGDVLYRFSDSVTHVLDVDGSGVSVLDGDGALRFVTATNAAVDRVERLQERGGAGPCVEAASTETVMAISDLRAHQERWPGYVPGALDAGLHSVMSLPMRAKDQTVGALNTYRMSPHEWTDEEIGAAQTLSAMATAYVLMAGEIQSSQQRAEQLQHALQSRVVIEQAKGVLATQHDEGLDAAFERLRRYARSHNASAHQVAQEVVERRLTI